MYVTSISVPYHVNPSAIFHMFDKNNKENNFTQKFPLKKALYKSIRGEASKFYKNYCFIVYISFYSYRLKSYLSPTLPH